jgi:bud site selection protein 20
LNPASVDLDKSGLGLFYCVHCDRHFPSQKDREVHYRSKIHKRRVKKIEEEEAYSQAEADRGAGLGVDNKQRSSGKMEDVKS